MAKLEDKSAMPYGTHKGKRMDKVSADYLIWLYDNGKAFKGVKEYVVENMDALRLELKNK